jgi:hypothetical protein
MAAFLPCSALATRPGAGTTRPGPVLLGLPGRRKGPIRTIAAGVKVTIGVVHKTLADAKTITQPNK